MKDKKVIEFEEFKNILKNKKYKVFGIKNNVPGFVLDSGIEYLYKKKEFFLVNNKYYFSIDYDEKDNKNYVCNHIFSSVEIKSVKEYKESKFVRDYFCNFLIEKFNYKTFSGGSIEKLRQKKFLNISEENIEKVKYTILYLDNEKEYYNFFRFVETVYNSKSPFVYVFGKTDEEVIENIKEYEAILKKNLNYLEINDVYHFKQQLPYTENLDDTFDFKIVKILNGKIIEEY